MTRRHATSEGGWKRPAPTVWLAATLLLGEFLWLASRFTTATLPESGEAWVRLMKAAHYLPQIGLAVLTILLLFRKANAARGAAPLGQHPPRPGSRVAALLLAQAGMFALFGLSTAGILDEHLAGIERPLLAIAVWVALALATILLGVLLFVPLPGLLRLLRERAGILAGGCILGLLAWWAGHFAADELSLPLRAPTLWGVDKLLGIFEREYLVDVVEFDVRTPGFWVRIAPSCSGFEGMGLMAVFALSYVWVFRGRLRFPQLLLLPLAGIAGMWLLNVVRIAVLVLIGTHLSEDVAVGGFHSLAGTLAFCLAALGLVVVSNRSRFFCPDAGEEQGSYERDATAAYLTPFLLSVAIGMLAAAFGGAGTLQSLRVVAPALLLWVFRRRYRLARERIGALPLVLGAIVFALWIGIPMLDAARDGATPPAPLADGAWLPLRILGSVCVVPLVEELAFRGYLMRRLTAVDFEGLEPRQVSIMAWAISSLIFGVLHGHWAAATLAGAAYGYAYIRRGRLLDAFVAHAATNALLVGLAACRDDWSLI